MSQSPVAIYVHTPFCPSKCGYCDFNSFAMQGEIIERTVLAIQRQIRASIWRGRPAKTVFFGGGTPTFLSSQQLCSILDAVREVHPFDDNAEVTSEANPGTLDPEKLAAMRSAGFNRLSLGAQSFERSDLIRLGRVHDDIDIVRGVKWARAAGFENLNLDLIFGLSGQTVSAWHRNLGIAIDLRPDHLSLYGLTIEPNTRFYRYDRRGMLNLPAEEDQVRMYDLAVDTCLAAGYHPYEISNFCQTGKECRHNLAYWSGEAYLAYGPGAVGCFEQEDGTRIRYTNLKHPERYCEAIERDEGPWFEEEALDADTMTTERIMLGLRLSSGIPAVLADPSAAGKMIDRGWLQKLDTRLALTAAGRHFCSEVTAALI